MGNTRRLVLGLVLLAGCSRGGWFGGGRNQTDVDPPEEVLALAKRDLTDGERKTLDRQGVAILDRGEVQSFHVGYTALFHAHQPILITADSLLYAWHSSYDKILAELETTALSPTLAELLDGLRDALAASDAAPQVRADLDVYLTVARSLLADQAHAPTAGGDPTLIASLVQQGQRAEGANTTLFGRSMKFDFSMLRPRGHYTGQLAGYFRAMSWLGRAEIQIATRDQAQRWEVNRRALQASLLLAELFTPELRAKWDALDATLSAFVGPQDSMSLPGLATAATRLGDTRDLSGFTDAQIVAAFEGPSAQRIRTQLVHAGEGSIAFLMLGQRYVFDSSVLSDLVWGSLETDPPRLMPTPLDVGHAVFHNPVADRLLEPERARYGEAYTQALARQAARKLPADSLHHLWLGALEELSPNAKRDAMLPAPLNSDAWQRRMLSTQLASWAELRHDNLLYAKQSFTAELGCEFPDAYVDPYPAFYAKLETLARTAKAALAKVPERPAGRGHGRIVKYFDGMAATMARLKAIAERERANQPLTKDDLDWINHMVSINGRDAVCTVTLDPMGWYAELYYEQKTALWHDPVIADVHTQPTDAAGNRVGHVLHVATGRPRLLATRIRHDDGAHTQAYRGFVSSYGELITEDFERLTDDEWRQKIAKQMIGTPAWLEPIRAR